MEPPLFLTTDGTGRGVVHVKDDERRQLLNVLTPPILNGNADGDDAAEDIGGGVIAETVRDNLALEGTEDR